MIDDTVDITRLLAEWRAGDGEALERILPQVYGDLRRLAQHHMSGERVDHTLQATALVHEAFMRLAQEGEQRWQSRRHFLNTASRLMRRLLVDHARAHVTAKRGGGSPKVELTAAAGAAGEDGARLTDLLALDTALSRLEEVDERKSRTVELRFFGGLSIEETAEELGVSTATVILDTRLARAWLVRELGGAG